MENIDNNAHKKACCHCFELIDYRATACPHCFRHQGRIRRHFNDQMAGFIAVLSLIGSLWSVKYNHDQVEVAIDQVNEARQERFLAGAAMKRAKKAEKRARHAEAAAEASQAAAEKTEKKIIEITRLYIDSAYMDLRTRFRLPMPVPISDHILENLDTLASQVTNNQLEKKKFIEDMYLKMNKLMETK